MKKKRTHFGRTTSTSALGDYKADALEMAAQDLAGITYSDANYTGTRGRFNMRYIQHSDALA